MLYTTNLMEAIMRAAQVRPIIYPKEFLHLGTRAAIDQTFSRLTRVRGWLERVTRGAYRFNSTQLLMSRNTRMSEVIAAIEHQCGQPLLPCGASEAKALGLTDQAPKRDVFLRTGRNRRPFVFGMRFVEIRGGPRWQLKLGKSQAGAALRALAWLGKGKARNALITLKQQMPMPEWTTLVSQRAIVPAWLARELSLA